MNQPNSEALLSALEMQCVGIGKSLTSSSWYIASAGCIFCSLFVFDTVGDAEEGSGVSVATEYFFIYISIPLAIMVGFFLYDMKNKASSIRVGITKEPINNNNNNNSNNNNNVNSSDSVNGGNYCSEDDNNVSSIELQSTVSNVSHISYAEYEHNQPWNQTRSIRGGDPVDITDNTNTNTNANINNKRSMEGNFIVNPMRLI